MKITQAALDTIRAHAEEGYPLEICGFLVGRLVNDERCVHEAWPVRNAWEDDPEARAAMLGGIESASGEKSAEEWEAFSAERRFFVSGEDTRDGMKRARAAGMDLLGVYHTHPNHPAVPSGFDRDAAMPGWSYIIASVRDAEVVECRSWEKDEETGEFLEEEVEISDD